MARFSQDDLRAIALARTEEYPRLNLCLTHHRNARGERLRFANRLWLPAIYEDAADKIVFQKASKLGVSEFAFVYMFERAQAGLNGMYILPTQPLRNRLVVSRIDPIIHRVSHYRRNVAAAKKTADSRSLKTIFGTTWNLVGANSAADFYEFNADVLIIDELDKCDQNNLTLAFDRLGSAEKERWLMLGNPTIEGFGIAEQYELSDQKVWLIPCPHCNDWQELTWEDSFVDRNADTGEWELKDPAFRGRDLHTISSTGRQDAKPVCRKCSETFDRLSGGEWVARHPGREVSGYKASRLFGAPGNDAGNQRPIILETFIRFMADRTDPSKYQIFCNNRLGEVFVGEGAKFDDVILGRCKGTHELANSAEGTIAGCDVGAKLHLHIEKIANGIRRKIWIGTCRDWDELHAKSAQYGVTRGVVDALPEVHQAQTFCNTHVGWFRCFYNLDEHNRKPIDVDPVAKVVRTKKTPSLDESFANYLEGRVDLPVNWMTVDNGDYRRHMKAATRVQGLDSKGNVVFSWEHGNRADHHQHADNYARLAADLYGSGDDLVRVY